MRKEPQEKSAQKDRERCCRLDLETSNNLKVVVFSAFLPMPYL
jgi:hypothetical protein